MNPKQLLLKFLSGATFAAAAMLFSSSALFAQVKIGTAPTTIGANNNLEVEAIGNQKVYINKTDGRTYIENKPKALSTDSLVLRAPNGELRQMSQERLLDQIKVPVTVFSATLNSNYTIPVWAGAHDVLGMRVPVTPRPGYTAGWNATTKRFTVPEAGFYQVEVGLVCVATSNLGETYQFTRIWISAENGGGTYEGTNRLVTTSGDWQSLVWSGQYPANTTISLNGYTSGPTTPQTGNCSKGYINITKVR